MKVVYTPKNPVIAVNASTSTEKYNCAAYDYFRQKRKNDLTVIVDEINRRQKDKYHLPTL